MIVNVKVGRIGMPGVRDASDARAVAAAVERAIAHSLARAAEARGADPAALARATRAAAADIAARCR